MTAFADYLVLERDSEVRHEFDAGEREGKVPLASGPILDLAVLYADLPL